MTDNRKLKEHDGMVCRSCGNEERASEGYPCADCGTFICLICSYRGVTRCKTCEREGQGVAEGLAPVPAASGLARHIVGEVPQLFSQLLDGVAPPASLSAAARAASAMSSTPSFALPDRRPQRDLACQPLLELRRSDLELPLPQAGLERTSPARPDPPA